MGSMGREVASLIESAEAESIEACTGADVVRSGWKLQIKKNIFNCLRGYILTNRKISPRDPMWLHPFDSTF